jgi:PAS domain S-box-containing protein
MTATSNRTHTNSELEGVFKQNGHLSPSRSEKESEIVVLVNAEGMMTYVSPSIAPILGYVPEELVSCHIHVLIHPDDFDAIQQALGKTDYDGRRSYESRLLCKDSSWRWFEGTSTNLLQVPGVKAIALTFRDITQQKLGSSMQWSEGHASEHFVQFYEQDASLLDSLSNFISTGIDAGDACIVVATKEHREGLEERLKACGLDLASAQANGVYISRDAGEMLSLFMVDGWPVPERFTEVIGGIVERAAQSQRHVRIFGEMVALLWMEEKQNAAIHLEELWNNLHHNPHPFSLFCSYPMHCFAGEKYGKLFTQVCLQHSHLIPGESYNSLLSADERLRAITSLQQKAHTLEVEIAERKAAEERLRLSENRYRHLAAIVESSDDAILSKDLDGIITSWNAAAERMYGYSAQEIIGQPVSLLFLPQRQDEFTQIMERIRRGESVDHYETRRVRKDGIVLTVSVTVSPVKDSTGIIIGASAIARNITEQRQLEAKFRQLFDSNLIGVFVLDFAGTFLEANDALLNLLGYTRAELQAGVMQRDALTPPEFHLLSQAAMETLQETGSFGPFEKEYLHKNGRRIPVLLAATRIEQTETCLGFALDITERKELDKRKDEFISMASHELKTPVTSLKGFLNLLQRSLTRQADEKTLHYLARMNTQVNKLTNLINDLLDISRMQIGKLTYREDLFEMDELVQENVENVQETTQSHHLQIEGQTLAQVVGDQDRLGQVLINLLNNAIKYSPQSDTVLIRLAKDQDNVLVSVQDFGIGIAKEHQQKIFERFYQVTDHEEKNYPGLGIGLYISFDIIQRHGGQVWVESQKGQGSTFHFTLPLAKAGKQ